MKYYVYMICLLFVLAFVGCDKAEATTDAKETTTEAVDDGKETNKKDKCGDCSEKCGGKEAKETVKDITDN